MGVSNRQGSEICISRTLLVPSLSAIFFSYIDPETKLMDTGFTEHSGCPVFSGEKKIVTQWIRLGVDDENTWDSFNTRK